MAEFQIVAGNFGNAAALGGDQMRLLAAALAEAGHRVGHTWFHFFRGSHHIVFDRMETDLHSFLTREGYPYGLVVTEEISEDGAFGWSEMENFGDPYGTARIYAPQVRDARFVWCLLEKSVAWCRRQNPNSHYLWFGHCERFVRTLPSGIDGWRQFDATINGNLNERRARIFEDIQKLGVAIAHPGFPAPDWLRDDYILRSRAQVAPQRSDRHTKFVNPMRLLHSVVMRRPLILEYDGPPTEWDRYFIAQSPAGFAEGAARTLREADLDRFAADAYAAFADERRMVPFVKDLVERSLGTA